MHIPTFNNLSPVNLIKLFLSSGKFVIYKNYVLSVELWWNYGTLLISTEFVDYLHYPT